MVVDAFCFFVCMFVSLSLIEKMLKRRVLHFISPICLSSLINIEKVI